MIHCEECIHNEAESCVGKDSAPRYPTTQELDRLDTYLYSQMMANTPIKSILKNITTMLYEDIYTAVEEIYGTNSKWDDAIKPIKKNYCIESPL